MPCYFLAGLLIKSWTKADDIFSKGLARLKKKASSYFSNDVDRDKHFFVGNQQRQVANNKYNAL